MTRTMLCAVACALSSASLAGVQATDEIVCEGAYDGHLQGVDTDGTNIWWSFTSTLVKTDLRGRVLARTEAPRHQGDLCVRGGRLYVAVNRGRFNQLNEGVSEVTAYDAQSLAVIKTWPLDLPFGAGGMTENGGHFFVVGGLPATVESNWVAEYDGDFRLMKMHQLGTGFTLMGVQTASAMDGKFYFGIYGDAGDPPGVLACPGDLSSFVRHTGNGSMGILRIGRTVYTAQSAVCNEWGVNRGTGRTRRLRRAKLVADPDFCSEKTRYEPKRTGLGLVQVFFEGAGTNGWHDAGYVLRPNGYEPLFWPGKLDVFVQVDEFCFRANVPAVGIGGGRSYCAADLVRAVRRCAEKDEAFALHVPGMPEDVSKDAKLAAALVAVADECARLGVRCEIGTGSGVSVPAAAQCETNFAFRARLLEVHPSRQIAADAAPVAADETAIDSTWRVVPMSNDPVVAHAARDLTEYLGKVGRRDPSPPRRAVGCPPYQIHEGSSAASVEIAVDKSLKELQSRIEVGERRIRITGATAREAYQGCIRLEDEMNARGRPAAKRGVRTYTRLFSPRMTHSGYAVETFPDEYLDQLAHSGMDAILVFIEDPPDVTRAGKIDMNALVKRAAERGIDVWAYASFPEKAAKMHPLDPGAREWYAATYGAIAKNAPGLKGLICVGESCGFPSRDPGMGGYWWQEDWEKKGTKLNGFWPVSDWPEWLDLVKSVTREHNKDFEVVFWTYNWFKKPAEIRLPLLEKIPADLTLLVTWVRGDPPVMRGNAEFFVTDYSIAAPGPSVVFRSEADVAVRRGIPVMTISNTGGRTWDSGVAPYVPAPGLWKARFDALKAGRKTWGLRALMESHHYGFQPNFISELAKVAFTAEATDADFDRALAAIAERDFGRAAAPAALAAWRDWDAAFSWHSTGDADFWGPLRVGPVYPLVMPGERLPPPLNPSRDKSDGVSKGMGWKYMMSVFSRPKGVLDGEIDTCEREVALLEKGVRRLAEAMPLVPADSAAAARRNLGVGAFHLHSVRTLANVKKFYRAGLAKDAAAMMAVVDDEERNVREAIPLVEFDSSLGWEPTMGYVCDRANLEWKLRQLDDVRLKISSMKQQERNEG